MTKHYDPGKVEALLDLYEGPIARELLASDALYVRKDLLEACAAVRASAREAGEVSEEELFKFIEQSLMGARGLEAAINNALISYHEDKISEMVLSIADVIEPTVRAALARFAAPRGRVVEGWAQVAPGGEVLRIALDEWGSKSPLPEAYGEQRRIRIEILDAQGEEEKK